MPKALARVAEAAGAILYVYFVGGAVTVIRLHAAGLPSGPDVLSLLPGSQLLAVGGRALLLWVLITGALTAFAVVFVSHLDPVFDWLGRWSLMRKRQTFPAISTALGLGATVAFVAFSPNPHGTYYLPATGSAIVVAGAVVIPWLGARGLLPELGVPAVLALAAVFAALMSLASAADQVTRLSRVIVETREHDCVEGPLIASTDRGIYLADGRHEAMTLIARDDVLRAVVLRHKLVVNNSFILPGACPTEIPGG